MLPVSQTKSGSGFESAHFFCHRPSFQAAPAVAVNWILVARRVLISAGEASGDLYAAELVRELRRRNPDLDFFGCAGAHMQQAGVRAVVDARSLAVVGLAEVVRHIPRIHGEYRKLLRAAAEEKPDVAILTDSPDFNLRVARQLKKLGIPVIYLVAPQVWAWRKGRLPLMRRAIDRLLCIFPFEPQFLTANGINATYIGHPLTRLIRPTPDRSELRRKLGLNEQAPLIALLPGSRTGEALRHLPILFEAAERIRRAHKGPAPQFILAVPPGTIPAHSIFRERISRSSIQLLEGRTWDVLACAELALAASGTVTIEAALFETPLIAFYRVSKLTWWMGRHLVKVPFYSMVNLVAGRPIVPELIQDDLSAARLAKEALRLIEDGPARDKMRLEMREVRESLSGEEYPLAQAASIVEEYLPCSRNDASRWRNDTLEPSSAVRA